MSRPGRNDPCPCGSGKKYKQCCLPRDQGLSRSEIQQIPAMIQSVKALHRKGQLAEAEAIYRRLLMIAPQHVDVWYCMGQVCQQQGRLAEAHTWLRKVLKRNPQHSGAYNTLGMALEAQHKFDEAIDCYRNASRIDTSNYAAQFNLGVALLTRRSIDEAIQCLEKAAKMQPNLGVIQISLGKAFYHQGNIERSLYHHKLAVKLCPDLASALGTYLFTLNYLPLDPTVVYKACQDYGMRFEGPLKQNWHTHNNDRNPDRCLKVGYVSPDFRHHSVAYFIEPLLALHDHSAFEVFAYFNHGENDEVTARIRALTDHWVVCKNLSDDEFAERIRADRIDILVDLAGHSSVKNRLLVFARKPAPIQVTYLGSPTTTGLSAMDWRLTTWDVDPDGSDKYYSEQLWRLPHTLWCYRPPPQTPPLEHSAQSAASSKDSICFGSMNNIAKISAETIVLWSRILHEIPESQLVMTQVSEGSAQQLLLERFAAQGIGPDRLRLYGRLPLPEYYALLNDIDIALDPFPYSGTTTTCKLLWMGIPVVTLIGDTSVSRSGYALLKTVGLEELCARNQDEYVRIVLGHAQDPVRLGELRSGMRQRMEVSPLRDEAGFTLDIEAAYRLMWRRWCETVQ